MRNAGLEEAQAGIKIAGEISITSDMQMKPPLWQVGRDKTGCLVGSQLYCLAVVLGTLGFIFKNRGEVFQSFKWRVRAGNC